MKISAVYKITNAITGDFYIGSSKDVKRRWIEHKCTSSWKNNPNNQMYLDFQKYGLENFVFEILEVVEIDKLKEMEQHYIETLKPTYNNYNAKGWDIERHKKSKEEYKKEYQKTERYKEYQKEYQKEYKKEYNKTERYKEYHNKYDNQLCSYNGETLTLAALSMRFRRAGIPHPTIEAKKYLLQ